MFSKLIGLKSVKVSLMIKVFILNCPFNAYESYFNCIPNVYNGEK